MTVTKYACNVDNKRDLLRMQSQFSRGPNMLAMSKMVLESRDYDFWTNLAETNFRWLPAYLVLFQTGGLLTEIASISSLYRNWGFIHIGPILGLLYYQHCKHIWLQSSKLLKLNVVQSYTCRNRFRLLNSLTMTTVLMLLSMITVCNYDGGLKYFW